MNPVIAGITGTMPALAIGIAWLGKPPAAGYRSDLAVLAMPCLMVVPLALRRAYGTVIEIRALLADMDR